MSNAKWRSRIILSAAVSLPLAVAIFAQDSKVIPLAQEPHHHLALHNDYVNVYEVEVAAHDSVLLHRHDADAVSLMMSESLVTVRAPGKPDAHQKLANGQVRLQAKGYVHATQIDGDNTYRNVTVELLSPQGTGKNLCSQVIPAQPLNCSSQQMGAMAQFAQPQFETEKTRVTMIRVVSGQAATPGETNRLSLIIALDDGVVRAGGTPMRAGDFVWRGTGSSPEEFRNNGTNEVRLVSFEIKP